VQANKETKQTKMETANTQRFKGSRNAEDLKMYYGTENYYKCMTLVYTDGVKFLCESRKCYWLLTDIALQSAFNKDLKREPFITCELIKNETQAILVFTDGNNNVLYSYEYDVTDFADEGVCLYLSEGVLMLPSEY
jgi:hypothetical protein